MLSHSQRFVTRCWRLNSRCMSGKQFDGKVALITGSTDGIGLDTARRLGRGGANVIICSRRQENVDRALKDLKSEGIKVDGMTCNVSKQEDRSKLFDFASEKYGGFDIFFQNAGINSHVGDFMTIPEEQFDKMFDVNVKLNFLCVREALTHMKHRQDGSIVLHASGSGYVSDQYPGAYAVSKGALMSLTRALLPEVSKYNIRINTIAPGLIRTNFGAFAIDHPVMHNRYLSFTPLGRVGEASEVSGVVSFLCSPKASYITGEVFPIVGGCYVR